MYGGILMSLPTIPNITPIIDLDRCDTINLLLSSIALEEIGLSHILNAEGEKLQSFLETEPEELNEYLKVNDSIIKMLRTVVKSQILLQFKLEDVIELNDKSHCDHKPDEPCKPCSCKNPCPCRKKCTCKKPCSCNKCLNKCSLYGQCKKRKKCNCTS